MDKKAELKWKVLFVLWKTKIKLADQGSSCGSVAVASNLDSICSLNLVIGKFY